MNEVLPFDFEATQVRVVVIDGEPWFVARDVASLLGYANPGHAVRTHCKGGRERLLPSAGGAQQTLLVPERDLYRLVMRSKLPAAERFEAWVVGEVLPKIRRTGSFGAPADLAKALSDPAALRGLLLSYTEKVLALQAKVGELEPKAEALDRLAAATGAMCISDAARAVGLKPKTLFARLAESGWIFRRAGRWRAYQARIDSGLLEERPLVVRDHGDGGLAVQRLLVTARGLVAIADRMRGEEARAADLIGLPRYDAARARP